MKKTAIAAAVFLAACATTRAPLSAETAARVSALEQTPAEAGELVYEGNVFDPESSASTPAYRYERRVIEREDGNRASTHITTDLGSHKIALVQKAVHNEKYDLIAFEQINAQTGAVSEVTVTGNTLHYTFQQGERTKSGDEQVDAPVVAGPTLFGFIARNWVALEAGQVVPVRFVVIESLTSYPFVIRKQGDEFVMVGSGLVALAVKPQHFVFDPVEKRITRYVGRVPQRRDTNGSLSDLDARVEYTHAAPYK